MRKLILFSLVLSVTSAWIIGCGSSSTKLPTQTVTSNFAFVRAGGDASGLARHNLPFNRLNLRRHLAQSLPNASSSNESIVIMKNDGTGETVLANNVAFIGSVQLSLDGKAGVSMEEDDNGYMQVYYADLTNLNKIKPVQLTSSPEDHNAPQLSPDGSTIIYFKWMGDAQACQAFTVKVSGGSETQISTPGTDVYFPTFTPDGKHIVFESSTNSSNATISMMNLDGSGITTITSLGNDFDEMPSVSPDGKTIVFSRYSSSESGSGEDIFTIGIDKSNLKQLTTDGKNWDPLFVNDKIVFVSWRDGNNDLIYSMSPDGSNQINLTPNDTYDFMFWD